MSGRGEVIGRGSDKKVNKEVRAGKLFLFEDYSESKITFPYIAFQHI